ncbi:MAG: acetate--CoA ligase family protein [Solirubrobacterales bacterium]
MPLRPDPTPLLSARSVAVVGASERLGSYGDTVLRNLRESGFDGQLWGVNPGRETVQGIDCFPSVSDLPEPVDMVAVAIPARFVPDVISESVERGCGGAVVLSAGFGEVHSGREHEDKLRRIALAGGFPVCGPNGNGVVSVASRASAWGDSLPHLNPGAVAMVSQSGNVAVNAIGSRRGIDLHTVVSAGNQAVTDSADWLKAIAGLEGVRSIALFQEDDGDGARLAEAFAVCADNGVRVAVLKVGSSEAGSRAAAAHTGAIAGDQRVFRALVEEAGAAWATDPHELLELARVLSMKSCRPRIDRAAGSGPAILTCSGGDSGIAADIAEAIGLDLPAFDPETIEKLDGLLPEEATAGNPLDYTSVLWTELDRMSGIVKAVGEDPAVDQLLLFHDHPSGLRPEHEAEWADVRKALASGALMSGTGAVFASTLPDLVSQDGMAELTALGLPVVGGIPAALAAVKASRIPLGNASLLRKIAASARAASDQDGGGWLGEAEAKELLRTAGVSVPDGGTAADLTGSVAVANRIGYPVAAKLSGPHIQHKSEIGAVKTGLGDAVELTAAAEELLALPGAEGATLLVEKMADPGVELIISARSDAIVPALVIGLGGIWTEMLDDAVVIPLPAPTGRILDALRDLRGYAMLSGARGRQKVDLNALAELASMVGRILLEKQLSLVELNPVFATPNGATAVDALIKT